MAVRIHNLRSITPWLYLRSNDDGLTLKPFIFGINVGNPRSLGSGSSCCRNVARVGGSSSSTKPINLGAWPPGRPAGFQVGVLLEDEIADDRHKATRAAFLLNEDSERGGPVAEHAPAYWTAQPKGPRAPRSDSSRLPRRCVRGQTAFGPPVAHARPPGHPVTIGTNRSSTAR
jgi:hypothetical protein